MCLHPNQQELIIGDQAGIIHIWNLQNDQSEQLIPEANISIQSISVDPQGLYLAAINNKVWSVLMSNQINLVYENPMQKHAKDIEFNHGSVILPKI